MTYIHQNKTIEKFVNQMIENNPKLKQELNDAIIRGFYVMSCKILGIEPC